MTAPTAVRPRIKILAAVWGETYVQQFARFSLASLLAPGNIPALAQRADVELVLLCGRADEPLFEALPIMRTLRRYAAVRYVSIDDLIRPGIYSVTLTLAFTRGMAVFGEAMTKMYFVYWNADFVLSDGGFAHLADLIRRGERVVITGTLRAVSSEAEPVLAARLGAAHEPLTVPARDLVQLSFSFQHPHHVAKTINQDLAWTSMPSQMLWRVDANTQVGRFFQAFMFCLQPSRVVTRMNGPCDYTFVPEYCPDTAQHVIADSDDCFILELQPRDSESEFIRVGRKDEDVRRESMREWLTAEHLDSARTSIAFRAGDTPVADVAAGHKALGKYFEDFVAAIAPNPHANQYFWTFGVAAWRQRSLRADAPLPPELEHRLTLSDLEHSTYARHRGAHPPPTNGRALRRWLFGPPQAAGGLHPGARVHAFLANALASGRQGGGRTLTVAPLGGWLDRELPPGAPDTFRIEPYVARYWELTGPERADALIAYLRSFDGDADAAGLVARMAGALTPGARVTLLLHSPGLDEEEDWVEQQLRAGLALQGMLDGLRIDTCRASHADIAHMGQLRRLAQVVRTRRAPQLPGAALGTGVSFGRRLLGNDASSARIWAASITGKLRPPPSA